MIEILGDKLQKLFDNLNIKAENTYKGNNYEVWSISEDDFLKIDCLDDEQFFKLTEDMEAWWRYSSKFTLKENCSVLGCPNKEIIVRGQKLLAWDFFGEEGNDQDYSSEELTYSSLISYLAENVGASSINNVYACVTDLANYNNLTLAELFTKYEGMDLNLN